MTTPDEGVRMDNLDTRIVERYLEAEHERNGPWADDTRRAAAEAIVAKAKGKYGDVPVRHIPHLVTAVADALQQARAEGLREIIDLIPTSWLDPLLTGPRKVIGWPPFSCQDVENLLRAIKSLVEEKVQQIEARAQEG